MDDKMELNNYQTMVLSAVITYKLSHGGNAPTRRELQQLLGLSTPSLAQKAVRQLVDLNVLSIVDRKLCVRGERWIPPEFHTDHQPELQSGVASGGTGLSS